MAKKRKTYYLEESTIQRVKQVAQELHLSENDAFERSVDVFEKFFYKAEHYLALPIEYKPLLLESVDNLIYNSKRALETSQPHSSWKEIKDAIQQRIDYLYEIRNLLLDEKK